MFLRKVPYEDYFFEADEKLRKIYKMFSIRDFLRKTQIGFLNQTNIFNLVTKMKIIDKMEYFIFVIFLDNEKLNKNLL